MAGPAATEPCVIYAQLLKPLCLDQLFGEHGCHFTCQDVRSKKGMQFAIVVRKRSGNVAVDLVPDSET